MTVDERPDRVVSIQEKLMVLISNTSDHQYLIRMGRQIADRRKIPWTVVWVDTGRIADQRATLRLQSAFSLAQELGAGTESLRGPGTYETIVHFIAEHRINTVVVGSGTRRSFRPWRKRLYQQLIESGLPLEVSVVRPPGTSPAPHPRWTATTERASGNWIGHLFALLAVAGSTIVAVPLELLVSNANLVLIYVFAVVAAGLKHGWRPGITASLAAFLSFNFFLTDPRYTFHVAEQDEVATLVFLLLIGLACGSAASLIRRQFLLLRDANRHSEAMRLLGQSLSVAEDSGAVWQAVHDAIASTLRVECVVVAGGEQGDYDAWPIPSVPFTSLDTETIDWSRRNRQIAGQFTDTFNASNWTVFPVENESRLIACTLVKFDPTNVLTPGDRALIQAVLQQGADTWGRIALNSELESARVKTEVEQLRSALLSSVSHDLKSPLSAMMGAAESLRLLERQLSNEDRDELIDTILQESQRLDRYIQNLLDMTRLGHGTLKIERDWVSIGDIIGSALSRLKRYFPSVKTEFHARTSLFLMYVHAALLEQALFNILENAARFSPPEEPVTVALDRQGDTCLIEVEDRGQGIPESQRKQIFDMFYIVSEGDRKKQNTGMGLAICRGMVGAHGGKVSAAAGSGGRGTRFVVELPIISPDDQENSAE